MRLPQPPTQDAYQPQCDLRALRKEGEIGCLKPGAFADLVVLDADPIADIRNARKIHLVMKGSRVYDPAPAAGPEKSAKGSC